MEHLFKTSLDYNGKAVIYDVVFANELYRFDPHGNAPELTFRREHDEWIETTSSEKDLSQQALKVLESYLLKQH